MPEQKLELLAPAKDKICAKAAIDFGADAIYIGASEFGARKNVPNSLEDIQEIVEYAHKFNAKVYVTLNTILTDQEVLKAKELVIELEKIGVDAIIVQDMGLIQQLRSQAAPQLGDSEPVSLDFSQFSLHASTQCDNRTPEKVKFLENVGFSRVILARELSIEQIKEIKSKTNIELETFIHGALCVSYSGQCYLSQSIGGVSGRSANRGECAQPCRKRYSLVDEAGYVLAKHKHLLSLKDFNASKHIKALAEAGVTSFKIEGRLKDENYVKNVVGFYRKLLDKLIEENPKFKKASSGKVIFDFEPNLEKSFNRGFTEYFLEKRHDCYSFDSPKSMGEYIGKVKKISGNFFEIFLPSPLAGEGRVRGEINPQDGLCFYVGETLSGGLVNKVEIVKDRSRSGNSPIVQRVFLTKMDGIKAGTEIYRNVDCEFEKKLKNSKTSRKLSANIKFDLGKINAIDEEGNFAEISYTFEEMAQNEEKMSVNIMTQLKKSGDTDFLVENVEIKTEKIPFLPVSKLNEIRRELLEKLGQERLKNYKKNPLHPPCGQLLLQGAKGHINYPQPEIGFEGNILNKYAKEFYEHHGVKVTEMALESGETSSVGKKVMTTKHCLRYAFNMCLKESESSTKELFLIDEKGKKYQLKFNCKNCEMEIYY